MTSKSAPGMIMPSKHWLAAYWTLCPPIWLCIGVAWMIVVVSIATSFQVPASGAVLVGSALISQMLFESLGWRKLPCPPDGSFCLVPDAVTGRPIAQNQFCVAPAGGGRLGALLSLTEGHQVKVNEHRREVTWFYRDVVEKTENAFLTCIISTAVVGTFLSGYGHLIFVA
jgi:hypothetical protein